MRDVAVISFSQAPMRRREVDRNEVEILMPVVAEAVERSGLPRHEIGFTCSGSCDYLQGQPFAFVIALDAVGAWPPINESHEELDAAREAGMQTMLVCRPGNKTVASTDHRRIDDFLPLTD